jgi:predicted nucleic acid-binding protein
VKLWLVDTGPLVAYLDSTDPHHEQVSSLLDRFTGGAITTPAVITEAMYLVGGTAAGAQALAEFVARSSMTIYDMCQPPDLLEAARMMERYEDTPMDFADATLLLLAEVLEVFDVLTLDRRGFSTYRTASGKGLRLVLDG